MDVKKLKKNKKGFTLVEIIMVLVTIGVLMALVVPAIMEYINEAADTKVQSQVKAGYVVAQPYATNQVGEDPDISDDDLTTKINNADTISGKLGLSETDEGSGAKYPEGAVKSITCTLIEKKIDKYEIRVEGPNDTCIAARTRAEKATK